jgi:hypothetical protein
VATPSLGRRPALGRVDRVAAHLMLPTEVLVAAMKADPASTFANKDGRISTLSVRLDGTRTFRYSHKTSMDRVAERCGLPDSDILRNAMKAVAREERRYTGVWTMSVRVW